MRANRLVFSRADIILSSFGCTSVLSERYVVVEIRRLFQDIFSFSCTLPHCYSGSDPFLWTKIFSFQKVRRPNKQLQFRNSPRDTCSPNVDRGRSE